MHSQLAEKTHEKGRKQDGEMGGLSFGNDAMRGALTDLVCVG